VTFWDDNATPAGVFNVGDMYNEYTSRQADFIVEQLGLASDGYIVSDFGCGIGRLTFAVAESVPNLYVVGVDSSPKMIEAASEALCAKSHINHRVDFGNTSDGKGMSGGYDGAWCVLTFQHLPDDTVKQHLADLFEILKPGARLVTQWVTEGEPSPMSYPRPWDAVCTMIRSVGFDVPSLWVDDFVTDYADNWIWVTAEKPA